MILTLGHEVIKCRIKTKPLRLCSTRCIGSTVLGYVVLLIGFSSDRDANEEAVGMYMVTNFRIL